jgi:hypothetical protein
MINFFRNVRKGFLNENKFSKYVLYALGEIVLVVVGILIALNINNQNEERKERKEEGILLEQLLIDFNSNLTQLDQKIAFRIEFMNSSKQLFSFIDDATLRNKDSIDHHIAKTMPYATFDPIINDLGGSGELGLIKNIQLKHALTRWTSEIKDVIEDEVIWKNYRNEQYFPFLIKHYQLRTIRNKAYKSNVLGGYSLDIGKNILSNSENEIGESNHLEDFNGLLDHPDFEDHLSRCFSINSWANVQSDILRRRMVEIIIMLEKEINKK